MIAVQQNQAAEISFTAENPPEHRRDLLPMEVVFTDPNGKRTAVPAFWAGGNCWKARYASGVPGRHTFVSRCEGAAGLDGISGEIQVAPHTPEQIPFIFTAVSAEKQIRKFLTYRDGTPFFWLADTWWMGFCGRIGFPEEFGSLARDRAEKGFSVVQIIAGLYPDMKWYDPRGRNEAGYPWTEDFSEVNPAYFDAAEKRIRMLLDYGLTPCVVGCWGFFMKLAGKQTVLRHWRYLLARLAAYPVAFCVCGEANMAFYDESVDPEQYLKQSRSDWNDVTRFVRETDPFGRLVTIHPTQYGHEQIDDPSLLDLDMLQTGHSGYPSLLPTMQMVRKAVSRNEMPVIDGEVCYEGICGSSYCDVQRYAFLSCVFLGAAGHTYGANGIWQLNGLRESYGPSPHGAEWGKTSWKEAAQLPGSGQIGAAKKFLTRFDWWRLEPRPEWVESGCSGGEIRGHFAVGCADGSVILIFKPNWGGSFWGDIRVLGLNPGKTYRFTRYDAAACEAFDMGLVSADGTGQYRCPRVPVFGDWIYSFEMV